ncbi:Phage Tail Collar Domain [Onishia taeanensis]|uniref:Phage Tail Collar Domain n=1 Tax=Onishia taeanensis TaxID=284577 RepID=A0A1G7NGA5_9GAMM|nr:phage tail protein [Halomonas taeanensis]SDF72941.1 Phage Tail Collar Domain [Halomonas taeanensis]
MAHVPTVPNFAQFNFELGDTDDALIKQNGQNAALVTFGNQLRQTMTTLNTDIEQVASDKQAAAESANDAKNFRDETQEISESGLPPKAGNAKKVLRVADDEQGYELDGLLRFLLPAGAVMSFPSTKAPAGWLKLNGAELSRTAYADLWAFAQASGNLAETEDGKDPLQFGPGDGATKFTIPDRRGVFPRAWDDGRGIDPGRGIGESQGDQNKAHDHGGSVGSDSHSHDGTTQAGGGHSHGGSIGSGGNHRHSITTYGDSGADYRSRVSNYATLRHSGTGHTNYAGNHSHPLTINATADHEHTFNTSTYTHDHTISLDGGAEGRPINGPLLECIRY